MGLASKLAAAQAGTPSPYAQQPGAYPAPSGPPPPQSYSSGPPQWAAPPPQQYQQQQQYQQYAPPHGAPPPPPPRPPAGPDPRAIEQVLLQCVRDQNIAAFYPPQSLARVAHQIAASGALDKVAHLFRLSPPEALNLAKLALFDICLLLDDSGSMAFKKWQGERLEDLNLILSRVSTVASLFDADGIQVRFLNSTREGNGINSEQAAMDLLVGVEFLYQTPLGGALDKKILQPLVLGPAERGQLQKPVLCIIITDGAPSDGDLITRVIRDANSRLKRTRYGPDALSIQIAQVGNDVEATEFLSRIDEDRVIGDLVDCTSNYEVESAEMQKKTGHELTPEGWLIKLLMGGIDSAYDAQDEAAPVGGKKKVGGFKGMFR